MLVREPPRVPPTKAPPPAVDGSDGTARSYIGRYPLRPGQEPGEEPPSITGEGVDLQAELLRTVQLMIERLENPEEEWTCLACILK